MKAKVQKIVLGDFGGYLGVEKGAFIIRNKEGKTQKFPLFECNIGEVQLKSGNLVSVGALCSLAFWDIDVVFMTQRGNPIAYLKNFNDNSHVKTRLAQYRSYENGLAIKIAKEIVYGKLKGQNEVLQKYGMKQHNLLIIKDKINSIHSGNLNMVRRLLLPIEGRASDFYYSQIFQLLPKQLRISKRQTFKAYDGTNNLFNIAYEFLKWKCQRAIIKAKLEPFLGYLHKEAYSKPSLICDLQELYRFLIDDFLIGFAQTLKKKDFVMKWENFSPKRKGKREVLNTAKTKQLMNSLNQYFETKINIPRIRHGNIQTLETLISEEAYRLASFIRKETDTWQPRIPTL
jgi:CRISPR-associated protein Cas1